MDEKVSGWTRLKINPKLWYITDVKDPKYPRVYMTEFKTEKEAKRAIKLFLKGKKPGVYYPIIGQKAIDYNIPRRKTRKFRCLKYDYPADRLPNSQARKTYRTSVRNKLRRHNEKTLKERYPNLIRLL